MRLRGIGRTARLPRGEYGVDGWIDDPETVARVRELYPPSSEMRPRMEDDRRIFLNAMAQSKEGMVLGVDKNTYVEPTIWTIEWAQAFYDYELIERITSKKAGAVRLRPFSGRTAQSDSSGRNAAGCCSSAVWTMWTIH